MTWWLWLLLVLAALVTFTLIGLHLWRRGKALLTEMQALSELGERLAAVTGAEPPAPVVPAYLASPAVLAEAREQRRENLRERGRRRSARAAAAVSRWQRLGLR